MMPLTLISDRAVPHHDNQFMYKFIAKRQRSAERAVSLEP